MTKDNQTTMSTAKLEELKMSKHKKTVPWFITFGGGGTNEIGF